MEHVSASRINLFCDCSLKFKFRYIDNIKVPAKSSSLAYGSAIHKALEDLNKSLLEKKIKLEDVFQSFHNEFALENKKMEIENDFFTPKLYLMGIDALEKYYNEFLDYELVGSEIPFKVSVPLASAKNTPFFGMIDAVFIRKGQLMIVDYKTSKEPYEKFKIDTSLQLSLYSYAFRELLKEGKFPKIKKDKEDYVSYYVIIKDFKTMTSTIKMQRIKITETHLNKMLHTVDLFFKGVDQGIFVPNYSSPWCKWCEYKKMCKEWY